ncbi:MAG TPA: amylo-alpha-1,6-glucosidase [Chloroflexota bacterium]|nr:amylo-alpha-1,6-glucosidase [Chloroflexota bacterium]
MLGEMTLRGADLLDRSFLLGNKRAFSLCLPAASGNREARLHPHKWFGAYLYGRKFMEAQLLRGHGRLLSRRCQVALHVGLNAVRRDYEIDGEQFTEEFFVPDGIQGIASTVTGCEIMVEPELDLRFSRALSESVSQYEITLEGSLALISAPLPTGRFDDATERFLPDSTDGPAPMLWAAIAVEADGWRMDVVPPGKRSRRKLYSRDLRRRQHVIEADHAPLWDAAGAVVYAPLRVHLPNGGTVLYGFGNDADEARAQVEVVRSHLPALRARKEETTHEILGHAALSTGNERVDTAYAQVLTRTMDALVVREAVAHDTALDHPAAMILAGNQYFHDAWKRDENIALGFLLALGYYDIAADIIRDTWQLQDASTGRLPQRIRAGEQTPYHSSDGTLWALLRLHEYWRCTGDDALLYEKLPLAGHFFRQSLERVVGGMLPSGRTVDPGYLWETWMDTPFTPRDGFPVEIQMLWIAVLRCFRPLVAPLDPTLGQAMERAENDAWTSLQGFLVRGIPADSMAPDGSLRDFITPNAYFCFAVDLDLGAVIEDEMRRVGRRQLAGRQGIRTLAPLDWPRVFPAEFLDDRRVVRGKRMRSVGKYNYHRGVEWNWLAGFFVEAELKHGDPDAAHDIYLAPLVRASLERRGIGGIGELYDLAGSRGPEFQTWSMAAFLQAVHAFSGVRMDVPDRRMLVAPQLPTRWPFLAVRKWYDRVPFDIFYEERGDRKVLRVTAPEGAPEAQLTLVLPVRRDELIVDGRIVVDGREVSWLPAAGEARLTLAAAGEIQMEIEVRRDASLARRTASRRTKLP